MVSKEKSARFLVKMMKMPVKMMETPVNMLKLPVNVMVSSMKTVTDSMQEIQRQAEASDGEAVQNGADEEEKSAYQNASRTAVLSYRELFKLPRNILASSIKTISETMQEIRTQGTSASGTTRSEETFDDWEEVSLTSQEAALESESILPHEAEDLSKRALWQIGRPGRCDFEGKWTESFDYQVGMDLDAIHAPGLPHFLAVKGGPRVRGATERLNLRFALDRDYADGELVFLYDRWGAEKDQVHVDGKLLAPISGAGKGKFRRVALSLHKLSPGAHVITITTSGETASRGHRVDFFELAALDHWTDEPDGL